MTNKPLSLDENLSRNSSVQSVTNPLTFWVLTALTRSSAYKVSVFASFNIIGKFILFSKPITVEESGLKGYYANVTLENNSKTPIELFAVSSEAIVSSK